MRSPSASFGFASSEDGATFECKLDDGNFERCASPKEYNNLTDGAHYFYVRATDSAGNTDPAPATWGWTVAPPPTVETVRPADLTTGVARRTNVVAIFSEQMDPASITRATFKLYKCPSITANNCTTQLTNVTVSKSADGWRATLNPYGKSSTLLASRARYRAVVTSGARDVSGNALDQDPSALGNQEKVWYFITGRT